MKRKKRIWIWALVLLLAAAAAAVLWQWQSLRAVHTVLTADEQTIAQELESTAEQERELLDRYEISVTPPTVQQREDLLKGRLDAETLKQQMGLLPEDAPGQSAPEAAGSPSAAAPEPPAPAETPDDPEAKAAALVEECVRSLYTLQVDMLAQLAGYRQDALDEWSALSKEERTQTRKMQIALDGLDRCEALEKQSDAEVRAMLDACREALSALGASTDVTDELWDGYSREKQATKTYFLSQYA